MPQYEAVVSSIEEDKKAEVLIRPVATGIPGVSAQVNRRVCHGASGGSSVRVTARNEAGAAAGDLVLVTHDTAPFLKNAVSLIGIPGTGLVVGIALAAILTRGFADFMSGGLLAGSGVFALAVVLGIRTFRRTSGHGQFTIDRVIRAQPEVDGGLDATQFCSERDRNACRGCAGPVL